MKTETRYILKAKITGRYIYTPGGKTCKHKETARKFTKSELENTSWIFAGITFKDIIVIPVQVEVEVEVEVERAGFTTTCNICGNEAQIVFHKGDDWGFHGDLWIYCASQDCDNSENVEPLIKRN